MSEYTMDWGDLPEDKKEQEKLAQGSGGYVNYSLPSGTVVRATLEACEVGEPVSGIDMETGREWSRGAHVKARFRVVECPSVAGLSVFANIDPSKKDNDGSIGRKARTERAKIVALFQIAGLDAMIKTAINEGRLPNNSELASLVGRQYLIALGAVDEDGKAGRNWLQGIRYEGTVTPNPPRRIVGESATEHVKVTPKANAFVQSPAMHEDDIPF